MTTRLADRLQAARQHRFAGRSSELALFRSALTAAELPFVVLYLYGPGGIGKTTLLGEYATQAAQLAIPSYLLDGRMIEPTPAAFLAALQQILPGDPQQHPAQLLASQAQRSILQIDTYELLGPLDPWLRDEFLPQLPDHVLIVLAGRDPPPLAWQTDLGWQQLFRALPLRNLSPHESNHYLAQRAVPEEQRRHVLDFTRGHPLALSLVADLFAQRPNIIFQPEDQPDIIKTVLELFVQKVPSPAHRAALEVCALVNLTSEMLLQSVLGFADTHELFDWLRSLSFISASRNGLFPHDLAREALAADLRWRNPHWYAELHRRARKFYATRLQHVADEEQQQLLLDYIYLHRTNPIVRPFYEWQQSHTLQAMPAQPSDRAAIAALVQLHEGNQSAALATFWLERQPTSALVVREAAAPANAPILGMVIMVALEQTSAEERAHDPAMQAAWAFLQHHGPLRPGERATHFRFWMTRESHQGISSAQSILVVQIVHHYLTTPQLAYTFFPVFDPDFWAPLAAYSDLQRIPAADYTIDGMHAGVFGHDWRSTPPMAWLALLAERELASDALAIRPTSVAQPIMLSEPAFHEAIHEAIQNYTRTDRLFDSPLLQARIVTDRLTNEATATERIAMLQRIIREQIEALQASPRDTRLSRALFHTYIQPAATQERAAELLDLPFSTYRRHLKQGLQRIAELLWKLEVDLPVSRK